MTRVYVDMVADLFHYRYTAFTPTDDSLDLMTRVAVALNTVFHLVLQPARLVSGRFGPVDHIKNLLA